MLLRLSASACLQSALVRTAQAMCNCCMCIVIVLSLPGWADPEHIEHLSNLFKP